MLLKQESYTVVEMIKDQRQSPTAPPEFMQTPVNRFRLYVRDFYFSVMSSLFLAEIVDS